MSETEVDIYLVQWKWVESNELTGLYEISLRDRHRLW